VKEWQSLHTFSTLRLPEINTLPPLPEIITFYRSLPDRYGKLQLIIKKASKGIFWDEELQEEYEKQYLPIKECAILSAMKSLSIHNIQGLIVAITKAPRILSKSLLADKIFQDRTNVTLAVLYAEDGKISIRRRSGTNIRCDLIAYKLGGGGHSYAAAGIIKSYRESATTLTAPRVVQELHMLVFPVTTKLAMHIQDKINLSSINAKIIITYDIFTGSETTWRQYKFRYL